MRGHNIYFYAELTKIIPNIIKYSFLSQALYKMEALPFQKNPENLDPSFKMDLDFENSFGMENHILYQSFMRLF